MESQQSIENESAKRPVEGVIVSAIDRPGEKLWGVVPMFAALAMLSACAFAARSVVTKAGAAGMGLGMLMLMQSALALPMLGLIAKWKKMSLRPKSVGKVYGWRVLWGVATTALMFASLQVMPASLASVLSYSTPLFVALLAPVMIKESNNAAIWGLTALGFMGTALSAGQWWGSVSALMIALGLMTGASGAMMQIHIKKLAASGEPGLRGVFWMHAASVVIGLISCAIGGDWKISWEELGVCYAIAVLSCAAQVLNATAYAKGKALPVNALSILTLPITMGMAAVFLGESVGVMAMAGVAIVLPSSFFLIWAESARLKKAHMSSGHELTKAELIEERVELQTALGLEAEPLFEEELSEEELMRERQLRAQEAARASSEASDPSA